VVREEKLDGIVMFADDSNMHSLELFDEVQKVEWIGAVSVGIIVHSSRYDEEPFEVVKKVDKLDEKKSALPVQGPACNSSDKLIGWHTFDSRVYQQKSANYIGDMAVVLPRKVEWCGFVMNSRLVWEESEFRPDWIKDLDMVVSAGGDGVGEIESPLSFVEDSTMVEPLGGCGKKVMMWWLRAEARADSKFPAGLVFILELIFKICISLIMPIIYFINYVSLTIALLSSVKSNFWRLSVDRWTIDPQLEVTVPAKRTPWPELPPNTEKMMRDIRENAQKNPRKPRSRRSSRGKRKHEAKNTDTHVVVRSSGERSE
ncbi:probable beta-1,4-xylosyltransferase IRX14, partial [Tanacetum coccineum]